MITFIRQTFGWLFLTVLMFFVVSVFTISIGVAWLWEHTVGKLWQLKR
jgi:hypothetical protein